MTFALTTAPSLELPYRRKLQGLYLKQPTWLATGKGKCANALLHH
jgi:hypothetical protein